MSRHAIRLLLAAIVLFSAFDSAPQDKPGTPSTSPDDPRLAGLKEDATLEIDKMAGLTQQMVDQIFSYAELGFQEFETSKYLTEMLRKNGFAVQEGIAGIPTAWIATWGSGKPVIALGTDIDCIPQASQRPGVAYHDPIIEGAPGHGEGHNAGQAINVTAALAVKKLMQRDGLSGTIRIWPGVAEEILGAKAYFVRDGYFRDVDVCLFLHVGDNLSVTWGDGNQNGLVSVEYLFKGESAHAGASPWRGKSALDAVELMDVGWNFRREHLRLQQRSHSVITDGGDQPNVVPSTASVWYYFRETDFPHIKELWDLGNSMAQGAALMTSTSFSSRILGSAWPTHMNRAIAETMYENIKKVGLPKWSEDDVALAKSTQRELKVKEIGLPVEIPPLRGRETIPDEEKRGGGSDDIGDISWNVPTVVMRFPSNFSAGPGHSWANGIAMATPIAHKGATCAAKVQAMTILDLVLKPGIVPAAWDYFRNVQTKEVRYTPFLSATDKPAIWLNRKIMERFRPEMQKYYFDSSKYKTYMDQLGIKYPTIRK